MRIMKDAYRVPAGYDTNRHVRNRDAEDCNKAFQFFSIIVCVVVVVIAGAASAINEVSTLISLTN
jgi:hypothetical protein